MAYTIRPAGKPHERPSGARCKCRVAIGVTSSREVGASGPPPLEGALDSVLLFTDSREIRADGSLIPLADVAGHGVVTSGSIVTLTLDCAGRRLGFAVDGRNVRIGGDYLRLDFGISDLSSSSTLLAMQWNSLLAGTECFC